MKKIVALVCVLAVTLLMFILPANAATNEVRLELVSQDENTVVYNVVLETEYVLSTISAYVDVAQAAQKGATVSVTKGVGGDSYNKSQYNAQLKAVVAGYLSSEVGIPAGENVLCTITFSNVTEAFDIKKSTNARAQFAAKTLADSEAGTTSQDVKSNFTQNLAATVAPAQPEPEEEKVVMTATPFITEVATSEEQDGWQAGQAVALQFATADLADFIAMNWKLTVADVNKFAKVDDAAFATIKATAAETVDVFASFIVNTAENKTATPITAVSAGFLKADGTVVEAE